MKTLAILITFLSFACQGQDFKWLIGTWKEVDKNSLEVWVSDGQNLKGIGYNFGKDGSKTIAEEMSIVKKQGIYYFISDVAGPQGAIDFKITWTDKNSFVAENPKHDFPKKIHYVRMDSTHLQAFISNGDANVHRFYFTKVND